MQRISYNHIVLLKSLRVMKRHLPLLLCFACLGVQAQDFAFDFFRQVQTGSSNVVVSPISAEVALSMLAEGTEGEGGKQILDALGVSSSEELGNRYAGLLNPSLTI